MDKPPQTSKNPANWKTRSPSWQDSTPIFCIGLIYSFSNLNTVLLGVFLDGRKSQKHPLGNRTKTYLFPEVERFLESSVGSAVRSVLESTSRKKTPNLVRKIAK